MKNIQKKFLIILTDYEEIILAYMSWFISTSAWNEKHQLKPELIEYPKLILHIEDVPDEPKNDPKSEPKQLTERQYRILQAISILDRSGGNTYGAWII